MTEPRRLKDDPGYAGALLRSASDDGPSADARRAIAAAIGVGAVAAIGQGTATAAAAKATASAPAVGGVVAGGAATKVGISLGAKLLIGLALTTGVGVGVGVAVTASRESSPPSVEIGTAPAPRVTAAPAVSPGLIAPEPSPPASTEPAPSVAAPSRTDTSRSEPPRADATRNAQRTDAAARTDPSRTEPSIEPSRTEPAPSRPSLADEVTLIDGAMAALRSKDAAAALSLLDRYDQQFPRGTLAPEATVARIEALVASGNLARARELAATFLAAHGDSPLAHRVRRSIDAE